MIYLPCMPICSHTMDASCLNGWFVEWVFTRKTLWHNAVLRIASSFQNFSFMQSETDDIIRRSALEAVESLIPQEVCFASAMGIWPSNFCCKLSTQEEQLFYSTLQITGNYNWNDPSETLLVSSNSGRCIFLMDLPSYLNSIAHILLTMYWTGSWYCRCQPRRIWTVEPEYYWWKWPLIFFGSRRCSRCQPAELQHISGRISQTTHIFVLHIGRHSI